MTAEPSAGFANRLVVAGGTGGAMRVKAGQRFAVVDLQGGQVGDLFAFADDGTSESVSASHTRMTTGRLFPQVGQAFASQRREPLATVIEDDHGGDHDMLCAACDQARYLGLGAGPDHPSCADNLKRAAASAGVTVDFVPQPVNVFMRVRLDAGVVNLLPAVSRPGDRLVLRAERPLVVVLSACPMDLSPVNNHIITDLAIDY